MMTELAPDRKHTILDAACRVIAQAGAARLRVADVAREAGVSTALVHYYFPGRADVIEQAFAHADDLADAVADAKLQTIRTGRGRVEKLLATWAGDDPAIRANWAVWNEMWQYSAHNDGARALVESSHRRWLEQIHDLIAEGVADGSIPASVDPWPTARRLAACVNEWGREVLLGLRTARDLHRDLVATAARELGPAKVAKGRAA
jgi:AcrR family transcriptional regulator